MFPSPYTGPDADYWFSMVSSPCSSILLAIEVAGEDVGGIGVISGEGIHEYTGHLGYWLGESLWGRGIATASVRSLTDYSLSKTKFVRLEAPVFAWNPASMRVLDKVGFKKEGVLEKSGFKDGQFIDIAMYAKVKSA
jgi:RimJ/RimL family protein N-acetyltransferase